ncbi:GntR family transcriptional regulator [Ensifer sp. ENS07]|uniref:GntR family transcriptional regulator n=1 Tax=Ensifer sp. ENS07 TaxID=2769274 RepID=UPI00178428F9|nr:GntR family transcriptional regulator [Ensifer sp. ENS07]MBD9638906.1 GntR family transcriptional regulator [Ensifer sp. ENS07]
MTDKPDLSSGVGRIEKLDPQLQLTVRDHVHRILRGAILAGRFTPDEKVNERQLAEQFGVSTTPVKEALRLLEAEGLVQSLPRRGILIRFNINWAEEMILARAALESMIGRLAARRMSDDSKPTLKATVGLMEAATASGNADELIALNETFHDQIHRASRCQYLVRLIERQQFYDASIRRIIHSAPAEREKALHEHSAIAAAIIDGDAERAEKQMRDHVVRSGETYLSIVFGNKEDV